MQGLDQAVARRVHARLLRATADPPRSFTRLVGSDLHKLRVGDWPVLALLAPEARVVIVQRVGHRARIYER
jgi:mRNA-degrading endonuclease RelE of RelBE toxin-antitoxin system